MRGNEKNYGLLHYPLPVCLSVFINQGLREITASDASKNAGREIIVCGHVAITTYDPKSQGRATFLNIDRAYPNHIFTIIIRGKRRSKFKSLPERKLMDLTIVSMVK